jgi:UTP--glucose-1-phosphate uridylyltransferase
MTTPKVAVIPVAGKGTRWMPVTRNVPKELLPVWRRTSASYAFEEAVNAGYEEIIFVISPEKHDVLDHFMRFDSSDLGPRYAGESLTELHHRVKVRACIQENPKGLGDAILCAEQDVGGRPFGVLLPDEVLMTNGIAMLQSRTPAVLLMEVPFEQRSNYGIVKGENIDGAFVISDLVEKPEPSLAPSSLAVTGRYTFTPEIFNYLRTQQPGKGGEIQLTDAMRRYTREYPIHGVVYRDVRYDVGQPFGLLMASVDFALRDKSSGDEVRQILESLLAQHKQSEMK